VDVPAQVRAKKDDTVAGLQATKDQAAHRAQESAEKVRVVLADKVGQARTALSEKAPPTVQRVERARAVVAEKSPGLQQQVSKVVSDATPVVQQQVTKARNVLAEKAPRPATSWHPSYDPCVPYSPLSWTARISGEGAGRRRQGRLGLRELRLTEGGFAPCRER
jgi:hypothetical protein